MAEHHAAALPLVFLVALLYSAVGHGGASGYLAVLALLGGATAAAARASALVLNLLVAGISFASFRRAGHFEGRLFWPFAAASVPLAWLGARVHLPPAVYSGLLAAVLAWAAWRLWRGAAQDGRGGSVPVPTGEALAAGGAIGLLSGLVGVGGGIFLSPLMILRRWADAKRTAAASAAFIWVNSAAGLLGAMSRGGLETLSLAPLAVAAVAGGAVGAHVGARRLASPALRRLLALVLLTAAYKLAAAALRTAA